MTRTHLGDFELAIMLTVARIGEKEAYGLPVRREVSKLRGHDCAAGAVYTTMQRLEEKGLLASSISEPLPVRGGRSRRLYRLTAAGRKALQRERKLAARILNALLPRTGGA